MNNPMVHVTMTGPHRIGAIAPVPGSVAAR
jgi:hypothetical protein